MAYLHSNRTLLSISIAAFLMLLVVFFSRTSRIGFSDMDIDHITDRITFFHGGKKSLEGRLAHAQKLWNESVAQRPQMIADYGDQTNRRFPDDYWSPNHPYDFIRPSFSCPHELERVGTHGDGGKWMCGISRYEKYFPPPATLQPAIPGNQVSKTPSSNDHPLVVYSFGVSYDSYFESTILNRTNAFIWGYDFSVASWAEPVISNQNHLSRSAFHQVGIGRQTDKLRTPPFYSVQDLMQLNGHDYIDIMKMDIEGAEFEALSSFMQAFGGPGHELPVGQLLVEIHLTPSDNGGRIPKSLNEWLTWWTGLEEMGLRAVMNEHNFLGDMWDGKPRYIEYTMINIMGRERNVMLRE